MMKKISWTSLLLVNLLSGCAVVSEYPITSASLAVWGVTGKGPADHALSAVAERDCATLRVLNKEKICQDYPLAIVESYDIRPAKYQTTMVAVANDVFAQRAKNR